MAYSGTRFRDAKTVPLEEKLPRIFRRIEAHRIDEEWRDTERKREEAAQRRQREAAMVEARRRCVEHARWDDFQRRSREWRRLTEGRAFLAAMREAVGAYAGPQRDDLVAHLDFAEARLDELDPVLRPESTLLDIPEPKPDDLRPFLDGWNPQGPEGSGW